MEKAQELWKLAEEIRGSRPMSLDAVLENAIERGLTFTPEDVYPLHQLDQHGSGIQPSPQLSRFLTLLAEFFAAGVVLDPFSRLGLFLHPFAIRATDAAAFSPGPSEPDPKAFLEGFDSVNWQWETWEGIDEVAEKSVDLIVSSPPLGYGQGDYEVVTSEGEKLELRGETAHQLIARSLPKLKDGGRALFLLNNAFFQRRGPKDLWPVLDSCGYRVEAAIDVPSGYVTAATIPTLLVIFSRGAQGEIFVGSIGGPEKNYPTLIENFAKRSGTGPLNMGTLVPAEEFTSFQILQAATELEKLSKRTGSPLLPLSTILQGVQTIRQNQTPQDTPESVYLPTIGNSDCVTAPGDFSIKPHNYLQLLVDPAVVAPEFMSQLLNTDLGLTFRRTVNSGTHIPKISKSSLLNGLPLPVPPLETQVEVLQASDSIDTMASELKDLRSTLWRRPAGVRQIVEQVGKINNEPTFTDWIDALPYPLAAILWNFHTAQDRPKDQLELLLKFFEALAEFLATVLLSAARNDPEFRLETEKFIEPLERELRTASFGTWVKITEFLSGRFRKLYHAGGADAEDSRRRAESILGTGDRTTIEALTSKKVISTLQKTNTFRNNYGGHGPTLSESEATRHVVTLQGELTHIRTAFESIWERYAILLPTDRCRFKQGEFQTTCHLLLGARTPFEKVEVVTAHGLEAEILHVLSEGSNQATPLIPTIRISSSPDSAKNACYFYNRQQADGVRYVSYQFDSEAEQVLPEGQPFGDFLP